MRTRFTVLLICLTLVACYDTPPPPAVVISYAGLCTIQNSEIDQVINNPSGNISIRQANKYYYPGELLGQEIDSIQLLMETAKLMEQKQAQLAEKTKAIEAEKEKFDNLKDQFRSSINQQFEGLQQMEARIHQALLQKGSIDSALLVNTQSKIAKAKLLFNSTNCMLDEHEVFLEQDADGRQRFGFLKNQLLKNPNFYFVDPYSDGLARIQGFNNVYGYIDLNGEIALDLQFDAATSFRNGQALVRKFDQWYIINTRFERMKIDHKDVKNAFASAQHLYFIKEWKNANNDQYDGECIYGIHKGEAIFMLMAKKMTYTGTDGIVVSTSWKQDSHFIDLDSMVFVGDTINSLITRKPKVFPQISKFHPQGFALAKMDGQLYGMGYQLLVDVRGNILDTLPPDLIWGSIRDQLLNERYIMIDSKIGGAFVLYDVLSKKQMGEDVFTVIHDGGFNENNHCLVKKYQADKNGGWGLMDREGRMVIPCISEWPIEQRFSAYVVFKKYDIRALFSLNGEQLTSFKYERFVDGKNGNFIFRRGNLKLYGVVNKNNAEIVPPIFDKITIGEDYLLCTMGKENFNVNFHGRCVSEDCTQYQAAVMAYRQQINSIK